MARTKVGGRSGLLGPIKKKERQVVQQPRVPRRREKPDYDLAAAKEEADEGVEEVPRGSQGEQV